MTTRRQQAQRRNSLKSPWRNGPVCKTQRAQDEWTKAQEKRERDRDEN